jgi:hypothetical protein
MLGNTQTAEDVMQETFLQLWRKPNWKETSGGLVAAVQACNRPSRRTIAGRDDRNILAAGRSAFLPERRTALIALAA